MTNTAQTAQNPEEDAAQGSRRKGQLHTEAAAHLRAMILAGELPPGTRLREQQLCDDLGVSRTPVREALRTLAAEGLVDLLPNRSVVVSQVHAPDVVDLFKVFGTIEGLAAELACEKITEGEIAEIGRLLAEMVDYHANRDRAAYMRINQLIHQRTVEIAASPVLQSVWQSLLPRVERARALANLDTGRWTEALIEHTKMFTALAARDGALLAPLTRKHFENSLPHITGRVDTSR
ncbi:MAG: hypothetical protein JWR39_2038 [Devosia sp.]|nr:hypothetical protein [Devosia sp.]